MSMSQNCAFDDGENIKFERRSPSEFYYKQVSFILK